MILPSGPFITVTMSMKNATPPGGPIFLYDGGENGIQRRVGEVLFNPDHYFNQLLEEFHGMGILWEHRYVKFIS